MQMLKGEVFTEVKIFILLLVLAVINNWLFIVLTPTNSDPLIKLANAQASMLVYVLYIIGSIYAFASHNYKFLRLIFGLLLGYMTFHIGVNLYLLITNQKVNDNGVIILTDALIIWTLSLCVFTLWYWLVDRGGPVARYKEDHETRYDLLFPQYQSHIPGWTEWKPKILDYFFFSFFTSTGFSPADTLPLSKRVKLLMMMEAFISLIIIGMVAARAISLIQ